MADEDPKNFAARTLPRVPLKLRVNMEFEKFSGFISEYSENISEGGMFIKTPIPKPVGSVFSLEFKLKDDFKLIQGWGEVAWVREKPEGPNKPAGMGIKFLDLDQASTELIRNIISIHKKETGEEKIHPFDFMKDGAESPPAEKRGEGIDLTGLAEEVFGEPSAAVDKHPPQTGDNPVDDIFKDLKSEIESDKAAAPPEDIAKPIVLKSQTEGTKDSAEDSPADKKPVDRGFVNEIFGKEKNGKEVSSKATESSKKSASSVAGYEKVSWYANPVNVMLVAIVGLALIAATLVSAFFFKKPILASFDLVKGYFQDHPILFLKAKSEPPPVRAVVITETPSVQQTQERDEAPKEPGRVTTPPVNLAAAKEITLDNVRFEKLKDGTRVTFLFSAPPDKTAISEELLTAPMRYLVKIPGVTAVKTKRFEYNRMREKIWRVRLGLHPDAIHIVFDLDKTVTKEMIQTLDAPNGLTFIVSKK